MLFQFFKQNSLITDNNVAKIENRSQKYDDKPQNLQSRGNGKAYAEFLNRHKRLSKEIDDKFNDKH
ncbi:MAG: hypothetical protein PUG65_05635 [Firmicutes bacterium]|nr:hypothetical protein [Bacillota bacterium]MDY4559306.1 hypothetical protein [Eubacteriales bacterium]